MSNVIEFPAQTEPHGSGEAFCMQCNHQWIAVVPVGETRFECPECHAHKGMYKYEFVPPEGSLVRQCNCGNQLFYIRPEGHMCPNCGTYQTYE